MKESFYKPKTFHKNNSMYGGEITIDDFNTSMPNKQRIENQAAANKMYANLQEKLNKKQEMEIYKHMTLEELREKKIISNTDGRPSSSLTDKKWQEELNVRKVFITPYNDKEPKCLSGKYSKESTNWGQEAQNSYDGCTNWQSYCSYINDILHNIRSGQVDYCYYIYQILDLLKFHYDDLRTRYCDGYWEVWLEKDKKSHWGMDIPKS